MVGVKRRCGPTQPASRPSTGAIAGATAVAGRVQTLRKRAAVGRHRLMQQLD